MKRTLPTLVRRLALSGRSLLKLVLLGCLVRSGAPRAADWKGVPYAPVKPVRAPPPTQRLDESPSGSTQAASNPQAEWVAANLDRAAAWEQKTLDQRVVLLEALIQSDAYSTTLLAARHPPAGEALGDAVLVLLNRATTDNERLRLAPLLPLDVPRCDSAQLALCDRLAPSKEGASTLQQVARNSCTQAATRLRRDKLKQGYAVALSGGVEMKWVFGHAGKDRTGLANALEACVRNASGDYSSTQREECLSALVAVDVARAKALLEDRSVWFVTSTKHFELARAVEEGQTPFAKLTSIGLLPRGSTNEPWESQYPCDILRAAKVLTYTFANWTDADIKRVSALGNTRMAKAVTSLEPQGKMLTLWFNGERVAAALEGTAHGQLTIAAGLLNVLAKRSGLSERWWVAEDRPMVMVGTEASLKQAVTQGLVSARELF